MALSDNEIVSGIKTGDFRIFPAPTKINPAGIDLRTDRKLILKTGQHCLVATKEKVELSENILGLLHIRSSLAREGIIASLALVDPGYRGQLTVNLYNAGDKPVNLKAGERFIQLSLVRLGQPSKAMYNGKYQDSKGVVKSRRHTYWKQK